MSTQFSLQHPALRSLSEVQADKQCVALIKSQLCVECARPTTGSLGQAGFFWPFLCPPCKREADGYLRAAVQSQAIIMRAIDGVTAR